MTHRPMPSPNRTNLARQYLPAGWPRSDGAYDVAIDYNATVASWNRAERRARRGLARDAELEAPRKSRAERLKELLESCKVAPEVIEKVLAALRGEARDTNSLDLEDADLGVTRDRRPAQDGALRTTKMLLRTDAAFRSRYGDELDKVAPTANVGFWA